jgi:pimeloyl-ACP methyl ester carboxylesterase
MKVETRGVGRPLVYLHAAGGVRWTKFLEMLSETHAVHMPTFPGFDGTALDPALKTHQGLARLVADYIQKEVGKPCDVMGASFGGALALWLALERPECVDHLVLLSPAGLQSTDGKDNDLLENVSRVQATTLILHGTEDRIITAESMRLLKARLRRAFLVYVWGAAHDIEVDQPGRAAAVVRSFLERSDAFVVRYA